MEQTIDKEIERRSENEEAKDKLPVLLEIELIGNHSFFCLNSYELSAFPDE